MINTLWMYVSSEDYLSYWMDSFIRTSILQNRFVPEPLMFISDFMAFMT